MQVAIGEKDQFSLLKFLFVFFLEVMPFKESEKCLREFEECGHPKQGHR